MKTVNQLIEDLKQFDPNTRVIVSGYEEGYDDIKLVEEMNIILDVNFESWSGNHDKSNNSSDVKAIYLG